MADSTRRVSVRLSLDDAARVKQELREVGETGQRSLERVQDGADRASRALSLMDVAVRGIQIAGVAAGLRALVMAGDALSQSMGRLTTAVGNVERAGEVYEPLSVALWQGFAGGVSAVSATIPTSEPTAFRVRAQARSGAVSAWREALIPSPPTGLTATGVVGGIQVSGSVPGGVARLQVFEAASNDLAAAAKLPAEPTALPWTRTGLAAGQARWHWLRAVSPEGNVSAFAGPVTATAL